MTTMTNMTTLTMLATKKSIEEMKADITDRFIKRTLEIIEMADGLDEYDFDFESQIAENFKLIMGLNSTATVSVSGWDAVIWDAERRIGSFIAGGGDVNDRYVKKQIEIIMGAYNAMAEAGNTTANAQI